MRLVTFAVVLLMSTHAPAASVSVVDHVVITSRDGVKLKGTYFSPGVTGPGIVLFHQCDGSGRESWGPLPRELAAAGFHVLTFDNRGTGESQRGRESPTTIAGDADAAYSWLAWQRDVDKARMAAGGSSCGVSRAANLAAAHPQLKALLLMSGGVPRAAAAHIAATPALAVFAAQSRGDMGDGSLPAAVQTSKHPRSTMKNYEGGTHGVSLFVKDRELQPAIVQWLQAVMK